MTLKLTSGGGYTGRLFLTPPDCMPEFNDSGDYKKTHVGAIMTKSEIEQKIAEVKAQGDALQKHNAQLIQQIEVNKVELCQGLRQNRTVVRYALRARKNAHRGRERGGGKRCRQER